MVGIRSKALIAGLSTALILTLAGCGSSSTSTPTGSNTGYFVDSPVGGLTYSCVGASTVAGTTGSDGSFKYNANDSCTFTIGSLTLGTALVPADGTMTPHDVVGVSRSDSTNGAVTNIAQLLQSLSDGSGNINISPATVQKLAGMSGDIKTMSTATLTTLATTAGKTLVDAGQAQAVMASYLNTKAASIPGFLTKGNAEAKVAADAKAAPAATPTVTPPIVAAAAPVLSADTITPGGTTATLHITSDVLSDEFYIVLPASATAPANATAIYTEYMTPTTSTAQGAYASVQAATDHSFSITGLTSGTAYKVYFLAYNNANPLLSTMKTIDLTTVTVNAPTLTVFPASVTPTGQTAQFDAQSNIDATGYWVVVPHGALVPSATQITQGKNQAGTGLGAGLHGSATMVAGVTKTFSGGITNLAYSANYDLYFTATATADVTKIATVPTAATMNTGAAPEVVPTFSGTTTATSSYNTAVFHTTSDVGATGYWIAVPTADAMSAPTAADVIAGKRAGNVAIGGTGVAGNSAMTGGADKTVTVTGLTPNTAYDIYFAAENSADTTKVTLLSSTPIAADTTVTPTLSATSISGATATTAVYNYTTTVPTKIYLLAVPRSVPTSAETSPTATDVLAQTTTGVAGTIANSAPVSQVAGSQTITLTGLAPDKFYDVYAVAENSADSTKKTSMQASVVAITIMAPTLTAGTMSAATLDGATLTLDSDMDANIYWAAVPTANIVADAPANADAVKTAAAVPGVVFGNTGVSPITAGAGLTVTLAGLANGTEYTIYYVGENTNNVPVSKKTALLTATPTVTTLAP
jgi:hypothetical protein